MQLCIAEAKVGETKCKTYRDCGFFGADCQDGTCVCSLGDDYMSDDKTMFSVRVNMSE